MIYDISNIDFFCQWFFDFPWIYFPLVAARVSPGEIFVDLGWAPVKILFFCNPLGPACKDLSP